MQSLIQQKSKFPQLVSGNNEYIHTELFIFIHMNLPTFLGDLLGGTVKNMDQLIRKPYGCGEQNMLHFVPNIVVMDYLQSTNQITPAVESNAKRFLELGYQRQLSFRHDDGSYSAFGKTDKIGSTWLTAFVVRSFLQAERYIQVEQKVVFDALDWLRDNQAANGSFPEVALISLHPPIFRKFQSTFYFCCIAGGKYSIS